MKNLVLRTENISFWKFFEKILKLLNDYKLILFCLSRTLQQPLDGINENSQYKRALMSALDVIHEQKRKQIVKLHQKFVLLH